MDKTNLQVVETDVGIIIKIQIPREELFWFSENQIQMLHLANNKTTIDQLRIIFIMLLEILSRGNKNA